jgi:hypothetical protein
MMVIGLLLFAAAAVVGIDVAATNDLGVDVDVFGRTVATNTGSLVVAGIVVALVGAVGVLLLVDGARRRRMAAQEEREIRAERERLAATVEEERTAREHAEAATRAALAQRTERSARRGDSDLDLRHLPPPPPPRTAEPVERPVDA